MRLMWSCPFSHATIFFSPLFTFVNDNMYMITQGSNTIGIFLLVSASLLPKLVFDAATTTFLHFFPFHFSEFYTCFFGL